MSDIQFSASTIRNLVQVGRLPSKPQGSDLQSLREGVDYVVCAECGLGMIGVSSTHIRSCSNITWDAYRMRHPHSPCQSELAQLRRARTPEQKQHQSETLKARFQTPEGAVTRAQISQASLRMMGSGYREQASEFLRQLNAQPEQRAARGREAKDRWVHGDQREKTDRWRAEHHQDVVQSVANARTFIDPEHTRTMAKARAALRTTSRLHSDFKVQLESKSVSGFTTEGVIGPFHIDELHPQARLAVEVDGCYWHGCTVCGFPGLDRNIKNDRAKDAYLKTCGWTVLRIKEHEIKSDVQACVERVQAALGGCDGQ